MRQTIRVLLLPAAGRVIFTVAMATVVGRFVVVPATLCSAAQAPATKTYGWRGNWTGLFPERLRLSRRPTWSDGVRDYVAQGKQSYRIASDLGAEDSEPPSALLRRLSEEFESYVHGLGLVRKGWERDEAHSHDQPGELLY